MKTLILTLLSFLTLFTTYTQTSNIEEVKAAVDKLFNSMEERDRTSLSNMLADDLSYGHSSGLVQDKQAFMEEVITGKPFHLINIQRQEEHISIVNEIAIVRHIFLADGVPQNGEQVPIRIGNCLVWKKNNGQWQLLVRQAYKLN